jgi:hypothetical protein
MKGWWREPVKHRIAAQKGWQKKLGLRYYVKRNNPEEEKHDYLNVFREKIIDRRKEFNEFDLPEFDRYKRALLPKKSRAEKIKLRYRKLKGVEPIEIKVRGGMKLIDFMPTSRGFGGQMDRENNLITIDPVLKDSPDWALRKGTIAHEFQHSTDLSEFTPSAVHNILRQVLLQNDPKSNIIGTYKELSKLAQKFSQSIKVKFMKQPSGDTITVYYFKNNGKLYQFAKDSVFVKINKLKEYSKKYNRQIKNIIISGKSYKYVPFTYANLYSG